MWKRCDHLALRLLAIWLGIVLAILGMGADADAVTYPFCDDLEDSTSGTWALDSPWDYDSTYSRSGSLSLADSPDGYYENNVDISATLASDLDLTAAEMPVLRFWHRCALETDADWGLVDVSADGGSSWTMLYSVTGVRTEWTEVEVDLSEYALEPDVRIRFRLKSDGSTRYDGWYIDDICVDETTHPAIAYPFFDDMEDTALTNLQWVSSTWGVVSDAHSGDWAWTDSPDGLYHYGEWFNASLTLAGTVDLAGAVNPQLTFWAHYSIFHLSMDYGYVEVSEDEGHTWTWLDRWTGNLSSWEQFQVDLSAYVGLEIRVRFRLFGANGYDGWYIDDIRIADAPPDVELEPLSNVTLHGADLTWSRYTGAAFQHYEIYRGSCPSVDRFDELVAVVSNIDDSTFSDEYTLLDPNMHCYRVYAIDLTGMYSLGSNAEETIYTIPLVGYPFCDGMEGGTTNWDWSLPWGLTTQYARSGSYSWTDSPGDSYENNANTALETRTDLTAAEMPVLRFWHRCALETDADWGLVDVSADGGSSWTMLYSVTGVRTEWTEVEVDLSEYALEPDVRIRFRLKSDGSTRYDGWYIDDICVDETTHPVIAYPFFDDMEDTALTNLQWVSSTWGVVSDAHSGDWAWTDSPDGLYHYGEWFNASLTLAGTVDLAGAVNPQLTFWAHYSIFHLSMDYGYVEVSEDEGHTWTWLDRWTGNLSSWEQFQVDLSAYVGLEIRVRFRLFGANGYDGWYIDDIRIADDAALMVDWGNLVSPGSITVSAGIETESIFGCVYEAGVTEDAGQGAGITVSLGYGPDGVLPSDGSWDWTPATYDSDVDSMDQYVATLIPSYGGVYDYAYRSRIDGEQAWSYGDLDGNDLGVGGFNGYSPMQAGHLEVSGEASASLSVGGFDIPLNAGETSDQLLMFYNNGNGALTFDVYEALGGGGAASGKESGGQLSASLTSVDVPWVSVTPASGSVPPEDSTEVTVSFDAGAVPSGSYTAYLVIMTNDLDSNLIVIDLQLSVNPPAPFSLLAPSNGVSILLPYTLCWEESADPDPGDEVNYDLWLSFALDFSDSVIKLESLADTTAVIDGLDADSAWYWKVKACDQSGAHRWCDGVWEFEVLPCDCPYQSDYDEDGFLTALDLGWLIDVLFTGIPEIHDPACPTSRGDFDNDMFPTALDLGHLIDHLFAGGDGPCDPCNPVQSTCTP